MMPVDEIAKRVQGQVLAERHRERELARISCGAAPHGVEDDSEDGAVRGVDGEARRPPAPAARDRLPEERDVGVVAA